MPYPRNHFQRGLNEVLTRGKGRGYSSHLSRVKQFKFPRLILFWGNAETMDIAIVEILNQIEELSRRSEMESDRMTRELAPLENRREDLFNQLSRLGNNENLSRELDQTDEKISELKKKRQEAHNEAVSKIRALRLEAEQVRNRKIEEFKRKYAQIAEERDAIRDEIIPELEQELRDLAIKKKNCDSQLLMLTSEINALDRLEINTPRLE